MGLVIPWFRINNGSITVSLRKRNATAWRKEISKRNLRLTAYIQVLRKVEGYERLTEPQENDGSQTGSLYVKEHRMRKYKVNRLIL